MISKSPDRLTFSKDCYLRQCAEKGEEPSPDRLAMYDKDRQRHDAKFDSDESKVSSLEYDLRTTNWILAKVRENDVYAQNMYAALCNNDFMKADVWPILKKETWSCSWRYAGGIIADMQQKGDYINWYCSGIKGGLNYDDNEREEGYVSEGQVTEEIREDLIELGWIVLDENSNSLAI